MRFFYGQNIERGYINVLFNYVIVIVKHNCYAFEIESFLDLHGPH